MKDFFLAPLLTAFSLVAMTTVVSAQSVDQIQVLLELAEEERFKDKYRTSYKLIDSALNLSYSIDDQKLIANCLTELGVGHMYLGRYGKALNALQQGLIIREKLADSIGLQDSYSFIATIHHAQADYTLAKRYYEKSSAIAETQNSAKKLAILQNNLGVLAEDRGEFIDALSYHNRSLSMWESMNDTAWISVAYRHIGKCYSSQDKLPQALVAYENAYRFSEKSGTRTNVIRSAVSLGELKLKMDDFENAVKWCQKSYDLSKKHSFLLGMQESSECLMKAHEELGDFPKALMFFKQSQKMRDSVYGNDRTKELTQLELNFQFEKEQLADSLEFVRTSLIQEKKISNQRIGLFSTGVITAIMILLAFVVYQGKQRSEKLLLNILPKEVAIELKNKGVAKAKRFDNVTVIFTDFKGFTELSEKLSAEELVAEIDICFSAFDEIMSKHGIEKIKTIGDAYMAVSGLPIPDYRHGQKGVAAALDMIDFILSRKESLDSEGKPSFEMRVGVHSGEVIAGIVGTKKFQYDIWGDTVNTAARLESGGEAGKVNVSKTTYELIKGDFQCESRGKRKVKGKGEMEMFFASRMNQTI